MNIIMTFLPMNERGRGMEQLYTSQFPKCLYIQTSNISICLIDSNKISNVLIKLAIFHLLKK